MPSQRFKGFKVCKGLEGGEGFQENVLAQSM